ncbi:hypothetical protein LINGRAHAP2_LOCUS13917, partial [Linum grandiflorum]
SRLPTTHQGSSCGGDYCSYKFDFVTRDKYNTTELGSYCSSKGDCQIT